MELKTYAGDSFSEVAKKAKQLSEENENIVTFEFNGIKCVVSSETNLVWLERDYYNSLSYNIPEFATGTMSEYPIEMQAELNHRKTESKIRQEKERVKWEQEEVKKRKNFLKKTEGVEFDLYNPLAWKQWQENNKDGYGKGIMDYAQNWAKLMQVEISKGKKVSEIAETTSYESDIEGITGFMYGAAVKVLSDCWKHGEELRKWHNKKYGVEGDGVVNPAILTIG